LTAERFLHDSFHPKHGARLYKTGDIGRWLADGNIEYLGRNDFQVKIRGFRIELGEIEARLALHPTIRDAVVLAFDDIAGNKYLVAYFTVVETTEKIGKSGSDESPEVDFDWSELIDRVVTRESNEGKNQQISNASFVKTLHNYLQTSLPEYMVPAAYVQIDVLPLTPNGKLDRKALPMPDASSYATREYAPPVGRSEMEIAQIWSDFLKLERIGRHDHFFELGGHSLLVVQVVSRLSQILELEVTLQDIYDSPVLKDFSKIVDARKSKHVKISVME
jgi:hypothetical protein